MKKIIVGSVVLLIALVLIMVFAKMNGNSVKEFEGEKVLLETSEGNIVIELYEDMPITAGNFADLVSKGFYDGLTFHRVIDGFVIQGGDPKGDGTGGPGYNIKDEFSKDNKNNKYTLSMANAGPNTGGSQFFINLANNNFLDGKHPVFGVVVEGKDVVDKIGSVQTNNNDMPLKPIKILKASLA